MVNRLELYEEMVGDEEPATVEEPVVAPLGASEVDYWISRLPTYRNTV